MAEEPDDGEAPDRPEGTDTSDESPAPDAPDESPDDAPADDAPTDDAPADGARSDESPAGTTTDDVSSTDGPGDERTDRPAATDEGFDTSTTDDDGGETASEIGGADDVAGDPLGDPGDDPVAAADDGAGDRPAADDPGDRPVDDRPVEPPADDGPVDSQPDDGVRDLNEAYGLSGDDVDTPPARPEHASPDPPASDGGYADDRTRADYEIDETTVHEGAPDDREMPLADHIEEMVKRLGVVVVVMAVVSGVVFPFGEDLINFLWYSYLPGTPEQCPAAAATAQDLGPGDAACPRVYHPLAVVLARLKVATLAGFIVALPVFVYETYLFMRPGLYPTERRYYLASVPTSLVLAMVGVAFAHFLVIPALFTYFVYYSDNATTIAFGLAETFDLMVLLMGGFAIIFQIPLFIMLALMMGLVTRRWMVDRRLIFWGVFAGLAFLFSPDPTGMAPIIVAATMIALFEGTLLLARWTGKE